MALEFAGYIELPPNAKSGGFDHAAVYQKASRLYVAHTANDVVDVIDCFRDRYSHSIPNVTGVAGVLFAEEQDLIFTSNRGENTVGMVRKWCFLGSGASRSRSGNRTPQSLIGGIRCIRIGKPARTLSSVQAA